jgi:hypothetical protein
MRKQHGRYTIQEEAKKACRELETLSPEEHAERVEENQDLVVTACRPRARKNDGGNGTIRPPVRRADAGNSADRVH